MASRLSDRPWALTQDADELKDCVFIIDYVSYPPRLLWPSEVSTKNGKSGYQMQYGGYANCQVPRNITNEDLCLCKIGCGNNGGTVQSKLIRRLITTRSEWSRK